MICYIGLNLDLSYTQTKKRFKEVQFNSYVDYIKQPFQNGYDYNGEAIRIKVIKES